MIAKFVLLAAAVFILFRPAGAHAIPTPPPAPLTEATSEELIAMLQGEDDRDPGLYCVRVPVLAELKRRQPVDAELDRALAINGVLCANETGDEARALKLLGDYEQRFGGEDTVNFGLFLADSTKDSAELDRRLRAIAQADSPSTFAALDPEIVFFAVRTLRQANGDDAIDDIAATFAAASAFPSLHDDLRNFVALSAIEPALEGGRRELAVRMLDEVANPVSFGTLLASRDYEAIWPAVEARVGEHYGLVTKAYAEKSLAAYHRDREDSDLFSSAAHALYHDGRWEEVLAFIGAFPRTDESFAELEEGQGWALNIEAYALDALGRRAEADAVFDRLASLPPDEKPWLVNYVINRSSRLVGQGRWAEGLAAADRAAGVAEDYGSTYAKMLIARDRVCALSNLGRAGEADPHIAYMAANAKDAPSVHVQALMCAGRRAEAAEAAVAALADEATREAMVDELQPDEMELFYTRSILPQPHALLATEPALREKFLDHARVVPERFYPAASLKR